MDPTTAAGSAEAGGTGPLIAFYVIAALVVGGALLTISRRNAVSAVMSLVATFFGVAALYTLLSAHFLAALQVLVYAGAIMTLFVFVVMVLNREEVDLASRRGLFGKVIAVIAAVGGMGWLGNYLAAEQVAGLRKEMPPDGFGSVTGVGEILFKEYLFPFEAISFLLLVAVIAAVVVARIPRRSTHPEGGIAPSEPGPAPGASGPAPASGAAPASGEAH